MEAEEGRNGSISHLQSFWAMSQACGERFHHNSDGFARKKHILSHIERSSLADSSSNAEELFSGPEPRYRTSRCEALEKEQAGDRWEDSTLTPILPQPVWVQIREDEGTALKTELLPSSQRPHWTGSPSRTPPLAAICSCQIMDLLIVPFRSQISQE